MNNKKSQTFQGNFWCSQKKMTIYIYYRPLA